MKITRNNLQVIDQFTNSPIYQLISFQYIVSREENHNSRLKTKCIMPIV